MNESLVDRIAHFTTYAKRSVSSESVIDDALKLLSEAKDRIRMLENQRNDAMKALNRP